MDDVLFCTLTNNGYANYTLNCLASLDKIGLKDRLHVYCTDKTSFDRIRVNHENTHLFEQTIIDTTNRPGMIKFDDEGFGDTMVLKMRVVHHCLTLAKYVLFTDGDIVYYRTGFIEYLLKNIGDNNILIQNDKAEGHVSSGDKKPVCCAGFMFIKKTDVTLSMYDMDTVDPFYKDIISTSNRGGNFDDQIYLRRLRNEHNGVTKMILLPSCMFPTYFVVKSRLNLANWDDKYLLHYNYLIGDAKKKTMVNRRDWLI